MKYIMLIFVVSVCFSSASTTPAVLQIDPDYVCTNRFFAMPESFDLSKLDQAHMLVTANPKRFEAHLMLATSFLMNKRFEDALHEFEVLDELASQVTDVGVLAGLQYEDVYAFTLFVAAERQLKKDGNDLHTLRMFQRIVGMDNSKLEEKGLLSRCYMYISTLQMTRGAYDASIHNAKIGQRIAKQRNETGNIQLFDDILNKAIELKEKKLPARN